MRFLKLPKHFIKHKTSFTEEFKLKNHTIEDEYPAVVRIWTGI